MRELRLRIREEHKLIQVEQEGAYTFVKIGCGTYFGVGFSKYNPFDMKRGLPYSPEMGVLKATNKAIEDVARQCRASSMANIRSNLASVLPAVSLPPDAIPFTPQHFALREMRDRT